jgi:hypothetical protein
VSPASFRGIWIDHVTKEHGADRRGRARRIAELEFLFGLMVFRDLEGDLRGTADGARERRVTLGEPGAVAASEASESTSPLSRR